MPITASRPRTGLFAVPNNPPLPPSESNATFKVYRNDDGNLNGFGYDIYINGSDKPYVHQPNIPAVSGNKGFSTEDDARHTAELMVYKIKHNIMPPSVSVKELDSLGIK